MTSVTRRRVGWGSLAALIIGLLVWQIINAGGGTPDPTGPNSHLGHLAVVLDSGILVLREGLETILVLAVLTASMRGSNSTYRKPLSGGAALGFGTAVITWFVAMVAGYAI